MTAVSERPFVSDAASPEEWLVEVFKTHDLKDSTQFVDDMRFADFARHCKDRRQQQLEREAREREDALQRKFREEIRAENERAAAAAAAQSCKSCFCIHAGEC